MDSTSHIQSGLYLKANKENIFLNINNPQELEKLYRNDSVLFKKSFNAAYSEMSENITAQIWNERLNFSQENISWGKKNEIMMVVAIAFIAGLIAKIPQFFSLREDFFYQRNIGFIVFPMLMVYFSWKKNIDFKKLLFPIITVIALSFFINFLPNIDNSDSIILACFHLPIFLWAIVGYTYIGGDLNNVENKITYLRYNGDFVVMTAVIALAGILFTAITFNLFQLIGINIETLYKHYIAIWGAAAIPMLSTYLVQNNPQLVNKISPTIAKIFTPIVFVTLFIFLSALLFTGKNIATDRNFLLILNALLIGVMAIILFSVSEATKNSNSKINLFILFGLSILTIITNGMALMAIISRLAEFGVSPNRLAVLGANLLIFTNLILVASKLYLFVKGKTDAQEIEKVIATFIPIYGIWAVLVTLLFPLLFHFK